MTIPLFFLTSGGEVRVRQLDWQQQDLCTGNTRTEKHVRAHTHSIDFTAN